MRKIFTSILLTGLLCSCSLVPGYQRPSVETPQAFTQPSAETSIAADWWKTFGSDDLNALMQQALARNNDLRASVQRIEQSRAGLRIAGASLLPDATLSAGSSRNTTSPGSSRTTWNAGLGIGYELDLFGANRASIEAADAELQGTIYDHDALALVVMGDVASGYFNLLNLRQRAAIADDNLKNANEVLRIINARFEAGSASGLEVAQQSNSVAGNEAALATLRGQVTAAEDALAVLLGHAPQNVDFNGDNLQGIIVPDIAPGQPSSILERRPDIRSAEAALLAANANIGVARAAFFPSLSLGIDAGVAGDPVSRSLALASSLSAPIFQGGRLEGNLEQTKARQAELVENYRKTVLTAFQEVEDALSAVRTAQTREKALAQAQAEAQKSYDLSLQLYKAGSIDFQTLLNTQNSLFNAQDSYAAVKLEMLNAAVNLYKTLGGGWQ